MEIKKTSVYYVVLFWAIVLDLGFFDFIDTAEFRFLGLSYTNIVFIFCFCVFLFEIFRTRGRMPKEVIVIILFIVIAGLSACSAYFSYGQSIVSGLAAQREWLSWLILLFPLYNWLKYEKITVKGISVCVRWACRCYAVICLAQYFLSDYIIFTNVRMETRYDDIRLLFNTAYFSYVIFMIIDEIFDKKVSSKKKICNVLEILIYFWIIIEITKGRMAILALVGITVIFISLRRNVGTRRKTVLIAGVIIAVLLFAYTEIGRDIINTLMEQSVGEDTLSVRSDAKDYYISKTVASFFTAVIGYGVPNIHNSTAMEITNPLWNNSGDARFYLSDVGITGIFFQYGLLGVFLLIGVTLVAAVMAVSIYKSHNKAAYLQFIVFDAITWFSLVPTIFTTSVFGMLILCSIYAEYKSIDTDTVQRNKNG